MTLEQIDAILFRRALAIAENPESTVSEMEWVRKFLNDHTNRNKDLEWRQLDPNQTIESTYGKIEFDQPLRAKEVAHCEE